MSCYRDLFYFKCGQNDQKYFQSHLFDLILKNETIATVKKLQTYYRKSSTQ